MLLDELAKRGLRLDRVAGGDCAGETRIVATDPQIRLAYDQVCAPDLSVGVPAYTVDRWICDEQMPARDTKLLIVLLRIAWSRAWSRASLSQLSDAVGCDRKTLQRWCGWWERPRERSRLWEFWRVVVQLEPQAGAAYRWHILRDPVIHPSDLPTLDLVAGQPGTSDKMSGVAPGNLGHFVQGGQITARICPGLPPPTRDLIGPPLRFLGAGGGGSLRGRSESSTQTVASSLPEMPPPPPPNSLREGEADGDGAPDFALDWLLRSHADAPHWVARWTEVDAATGQSWLTARAPLNATKFLSHVVRRACEGDETCRRPPREFERLAAQAEARAERERVAARRAAPPAAPTPQPVPTPAPAPRNPAVAPDGAVAAIWQELGPVFSAGVRAIRIEAGSEPGRPRLIVKTDTPLHLDAVRRRLKRFEVVRDED